MNNHRKEQAQQAAGIALMTVGIIASGLLGGVLWLLAVMYV